MAAAKAQEGQRVALIEMEQVGGTCLNHGCKPTKALRASADRRPHGPPGRRVRRAHRRGHGGLRHRHRAACTGSSTGCATSLRRLDLRRRRPRPHRGRRPRCGPIRRRPAPGRGRRSHADRARGLPQPRAAGPASRRSPGSTTSPYLTEVELLHLTELPEHLVIVGGGYIGLRVRPDVPPVRRPRSPCWSAAASPPARTPTSPQLIADQLTDEGVEIRLHPAGPGLRRPTAESRSSSTTDDPVTGSHLLVATGRRSNSDLLGPDHGIETDDRGFFTIDNRFADLGPRRLGAGRRQRSRRLHPHRLPGRPDPARSEPLARRPDHRVRDVHRPAAGPGRDDRRRRPGSPAARCSRPRCRCPASAGPCWRARPSG